MNVGRLEGRKDGRLGWTEDAERRQVDKVDRRERTGDGGRETGEKLLSVHG